MRVCVHLRLIKVFLTRESNMIRKWNVQRSTSLTELQMALEVHGYKPQTTNLSILSHTSAIYSTNRKY